MNPYDVFICFKSEDLAYAREVYDYLQENSLNPFFSPVSLEDVGESDFTAAIFEALESITHMVVVTSSAEYVNTDYVKAEWMAFFNEKYKGKKKGNIVTVLFGDMSADELPMPLSHYQVLPWGKETQKGILRYLSPAIQEIFRIDINLRKIYWGRRPTQHKDLKSLTEDQRIDGDKKGRTVTVWKSSYADRRLCSMAAQIIREGVVEAKNAQIDLSNIVIKDNNGTIL